MYLRDDEKHEKLLTTMRRIAWCKVVGKHLRSGKCGRYYRRLCRRRDRLISELPPGYAANALPALKNDRLSLSKE